MAAPATISEFIELIRKSGIVDEKRFEPYLEKLRTSGKMPSAPTQLANDLVQDGLLTKFQAEQLLQGKWRRFTIGKYKVLERLGSGGMGSVYLCEHKMMRRRVAVKVLPTAKAQDEASLQRFYREARAVAALDHPNIVHAYDIDQDETLHFLVMEYVDGASLQDLVKKTGPMDWQRAANYMRQAAEGLIAAHEKALVHRDIKPGNLLVDRTGVLKILDMGLARFFNDEEDILTKKYDENILGTADYLAPEQAIDSHTVDIRADIYSLGGTFYYLLTGKTPFGEGTVAQKLLWHQTRQPQPIARFRNDLPPELLAVIDKMMVKDLNLRYQTPEELALALAPFTTEEVPPPTEIEIPRLSPALYGPESQSSVSNASSAGSRRGSPWKVVAPTSSTKPVTPPSLPKLPHVAPAATATQPYSATGSGRTHGPAPGGSARMPAALTQTATPTNETVEADVSAETDLPVMTGSSLRQARKAAAQERKRYWYVILFLFIFFAAGGGFAAWKYFFERTTDNPAPTERKPLEVGRGRGHTSIQQALLKAEPGAVIQIWDERHEENVVVDPSRGATRVTITAAPGKVVVWTFKKGEEAKQQPLLHLSKAGDFQLQGANLTIDGQGALASLVLVTGQCDGLALEGATLKDFTEHGIKLINTAGSDKKPIVFKDLRFSASKKLTPAAALFFDAVENIKPQVNDWISIHESCRFEGMQPVLRKSNLATGAHIILPATLSWE